MTVSSIVLGSGTSTRFLGVSDMQPWQKNSVDTRGNTVHIEYTQYYIGEIEMAILHVEGLHKRYPAFHLKDVSFTLEPGYIMGFIGANGAGKTTTLKSIVNLVKKDSGRV